MGIEEGRVEGRVDLQGRRRERGVLVQKSMTGSDAA